jgi:hypothetical protein
MIECEFTYTPTDSGKFHATCGKCGRSVYTKTQNAFAACRSVRQEISPQQLVNTAMARASTAQRGPGTELKKLLSRIGISSTPDCSCNARARTMDENGCDWCEANIDTIVGWLREEATKRKLPFVDIAGRLLVKRAIRNARKAAS